jgi:hypothetical protein
MSHIDDVKAKVKDYFSHDSGPSYVRLLDTPHIWGKPFSKDGIMPAVRARTKEFEKAVIEVIQRAKYRCDVASLNCPDADWGKVILNAMDIALSTNMNRGGTRTQFRFLFGQTPTYLMDGGARYVDFQGALIRWVRERSKHWEVMPEIWMSKFSRIGEGVLSEALPILGIESPEDDEESTKMTWNHSKIIAADGAEALVGGHNLNMDLFNSYPPVHDVSVAVHGEAALGSQQFLDRMWACGTDLLVKEYLDSETLRWKSGDDRTSPKLKDPLQDELVQLYMKGRLAELVELHGGLLQSGVVRNKAPKKGTDEIEDIRKEDLQTLLDLELPVFKEKDHSSYAKLEEYKAATRIFSVGKYWTGPDMRTQYHKASELMKEQLIKGARQTLRFSQMDLVSAWKKKWSSHVVCHWIMDALRDNESLIVQVVVSPLDAGAGAEGDQYSFGSGAVRTFDLIKYYTTHDIDGTKFRDADERAKRLERLHIAPFYFTNVPEGMTIEGLTYKWPKLPEKGKTASLKQPSLQERPPKDGIIGNALAAVLNAGGNGIPIVGRWYQKVTSAPGNHAKITIVDDELYVVGSDNLYPGFLSEFNYLIEGKAAVDDLIKSYWNPLWQYSGQHCVNPMCGNGCVTISKDKSQQSSSGFGPLLLSHEALRRAFSFSGLGGKGLGSKGLGRSNSLGGIGGKSVGGLGGNGLGLGVGAPPPPLLNRVNLGRVERVDVSDKLESLDVLKSEDELFARKGVEARKKEAEKSTKEPPKKEPSTTLGLSSPKKESSTTLGLSSPKKEDQKGSDLSGDHYYTDREIFRLMEHYLGDLPNVVVCPGIDGYTLRRLEPDAYRDAVPKVRRQGEPLTIVQPFNVNHNHWGLLYIKVDQVVGQQRRTARALYIDPLHPDDVPNLRPLRRVFSELAVERTTIRYQNDGEEGQHSCGAWIVCLAYCLAHFSDVVPRPEVSPRTAAIELRKMHQTVMEQLGPDV